MNLFPLFLLHLPVFEKVTYLIVLFQEVTIASAQVLFVLNGPLVSLFYGAWKKNEFKQLTDKMDDLCQAIQEANLERLDFFKNLYRSDASLLSVGTRVMMKATACCPTITCFSGPIAGLFDGTYGQRLALPIHCPYELNYRPIYEVLVIMEVS